MEHYTSNAQNALVIGKNLGSRWSTFAISDLTLKRGHSMRSQGAAGAKCVERAYTRLPEEFGYLRRVKCDTLNIGDDAVFANAVGQNDTQKFAAVWTRGAINTEITDSVFDQAVGVFLNGQGQIDSSNFMAEGATNTNAYLRISGNAFNWRFAAIQTQKTLHNLVYSHNDEVMQGTEEENSIHDLADAGDFFSAFRHNIRDLFIANTKTSRSLTGGTSSTCKDMPGSNHPICVNLGTTLDGNNGAYLGRLDSSNLPSEGALQLTLAADTAQVINPANQGILAPAQRGALVQIVQGKGVGQYRHLVSDILTPTGCSFATCTPVRVITVDKPWDVQPDATSWISITDYMGRLIFYGNDYSFAPKLQTYFATHDVLVVDNQLGTESLPAGVSSKTGSARGGESGSMTRGWGYQALNNLIRLQGAGLGESVGAEATTNGSNLRAVPETGFHYVSPVADAVNGFKDRNNSPATHVYRNNANESGGQLTVDLWFLNDGILIENNLDMRDRPTRNGQMIGYKINGNWVLSPENVALIRNNTAATGNLAQQGMLDGNDYPANPVPTVLLANDLPDIFNLARSGYAISYPGEHVNGAYSVLDRVRPIDGNTSGDSGSSGGLGTTGSRPGTGIKERWFEVDLRHQADVSEVRVWPGDGDTTGSANLTVLVSDQPFVSSTLDNAKLEVGAGRHFYMDGAIPSGGRTVVVQKSGRYVRVWKTVATDNLALVLAEIEVMGRALRANLDVTVEPSRYDVALNEYVDFTATVTNYGPQSVDGLQISGLSSCVLSPTALGVEASDNTATCTSSEYANEFGRLERAANISTSQDLNGEFSGGGTAFVNVQAELKLVKVNAIGSVATVPVRSPRSETVNGSITVTDRLFPGNSTVQLIATPDSGHAVAWTDCTVDTVDPNKCTVVMNAQKVVYANFSPVTSSANIAVAASAAPSSVALNSNISYTFTVSNAGPQTATNVTLTTGTLPAGTSFISASAGCTFASGIVTCAMGSINNGASFPLTITLKGDTAGAKTLSASATRTESDLDASNNTNKSASATVNPEANLIAGLTVSHPGTNAALTEVPYTYTATVTNNGPSTATGVTATITLPPGVTGTASGCSLSGSTLTCNLGNLANSGVATITVNATAQAEAIFDNTSITTFQASRIVSMNVTSGVTDSVPGNNSASVSTNVKLACNGQAVAKRGTSGADTSLASTAGADIVHLLSGNDSFNGGAGNDSICGGLGDDYIVGSGGNDTLIGGAGTDTCYGGFGSNTRLSCEDGF